MKKDKTPKAPNWEGFAKSHNWGSAQFRTEIMRAAASLGTITLDDPDFDEDVYNYTCEDEKGLIAITIRRV